MDNQSYTTSFSVNKSPEEVFAAIINPRAWWSGENEGSADKLHAEFTHTYKDDHICKLQVVELIPYEKVVWHVLENYFKFTKDKKEWTGNDLIFEISKSDNVTQVKFTQKGLIPEYECYDICSNAWGGLINGNLKNFITSGSSISTV